MSAKRCAKCGLSKPLSMFSKKDKDGRLHSYCKQCNAALILDWQRRNPDKRREYQRRQVANGNSARRSRKHILKGFGLTLDEYAAMLDAQSGVCAICCREKDETLCVDHDHGTQAVRGLLCRHCNSLLGMCHESAAILQAARDYLVKHGK